MKVVKWSMNWPNGNALFQTHLLLMTIYGSLNVRWYSCTPMYHWLCDITLASNDPRKFLPCDQFFKIAWPINDLSYLCAISTKVTLYLPTYLPKREKGQPIARSRSDRKKQENDNLHRHYSLCYFVHRHLSNAWYNQAHSLIGPPYLAIIASNEGLKHFPRVPVSHH